MERAAQPVTLSRRVTSTLIVATLWALVAVPLLIPSWQCPSARFSHVPCPGCGVTRAWLLLIEGDLGGSLAMHPLAVPAVLAEIALAVVSLGLAYRVGAPYAVFEARSGKLTLYVLIAVMTLNFLLWLARACGALGGPVPV